MAKNSKFISQKNQNKLQEIGRLIMNFMNKNSTKIYNYKQISDGIDYKNPRQRELVIQAIHKLLAENRIKELKYDFGFDSFNLKDFFATESALIFAMIAYNLMSLFRTFVLQEKTQKKLSILRYRTFAIGAYFEKQNDKLVLKIALNKKRRSWFSGLWNYSKTCNYPFGISNA